MCEFSVEDRVKVLVLNKIHVDPDEVVEEADFVDDLGADSLDLVELFMAAEETFDIEISDDEAEGMKTVKDLTEFVRAVA